MSIATARTTLSITNPGDAEALSRFYRRNAAHLARWEPVRPESFHDATAWRDRLEAGAEAIAQGRFLPMVARRRDMPVEIVAVSNFNNIVGGVFQAAHLGYSVDAAHEGTGLMREVLAAALDHVFDQVGLHRVMANYLPENTRSAVLLKSLGFEEEGYARSYLKIAGEWRDHVLTAKINPAGDT